MPKSQHDNTTDSLNLILSLLKSFPTMSDEELLEHVNNLVHVKKSIGLKTLGKYIKDLVDTGRAVHRIVPTDDVPPSYSRFHVYIETTFQQEADEPVEVALRYQEWVAEEVQRRLREKYSKALISRGVDILLGADWDMVLTVDATDQLQLHPFITRDVRTCRHVLRTRTAWVQKVINLSPIAKSVRTGDDVADTPGAQRDQDISQQSEGEPQP